MKIFTSYLMGGLGNQLFQIATCIAKAKENNATPKFRLESHNPNQGRGAKYYLKNIFSKLQFDDNIDRFFRVSEKSFGYSELEIPEDCNIEFFGYFQSSKYFKKYEKDIKSIFEPNLEFIEKITNKYPQLQLENTVSIHIRKGDYLKFPRIHPTLDVSYIKEAIKKTENSFIFVFSDDKNWAASNLKFDNMIIVENEEDYEDLWMMSLCKNNIISNSTFSWWASFLNKNSNKKVISPSIWFGPDGPQDYCDIFEENFTIINTTFKEGILYATFKEGILHA